MPLASGHNNIISGIYAVADPDWNRLPTVTALVESLLCGGCRLLQLRMKHASTASILQTARDIMTFKRSYDFTFIVNDHPEVACAAGADGVHVGGKDTSIASLRKKFGDSFLIGYSCWHDPDSAKKAEAAGADYVSLGAIFPTKTRGPEHPVYGLHALQKFVQSVSIPVVAIGGIGRSNIKRVFGTGVQAAAMMTALSHAPDVKEEVRWFLQATKNLF